MAIDIPVYYFKIGQCSTTAGTPGDNPLPPVYQALIVKVDECCTGGKAGTFVKREPFPCPIARGTETLVLIRNRPARVINPFPDMFHEFFAADNVPVDTLLQKLLLNDYLRRYSGMINARKPESGITLHSMPPD